jgi:hypothetical protein
MDETRVFAKTPKGTAEVTLRVGGLSLQARRVLIMIDGERSVGELAPLLREGEIDAVIALLHARGFIRDAGPGNSESARPRTRGDLPSGPDTAGSLVRSTEANSVPEQRVYLTIEEVKRRAVRELNERLGSGAESIAMRIERSTGADDLRERLREAERLVARLVGEASAQDFVRAMRRR